MPACKRCQVLERLPHAKCLLDLVLIPQRPSMCHDGFAIEANQFSFSIGELGAMGQSTK
jgi:hypothetical protein